MSKQKSKSDKKEGQEKIPDSVKRAIGLGALKRDYLNLNPLSGGPKDVKELEEMLLFLLRQS